MRRRPRRPTRDDASRPTPQAAAASADDGRRRRGRRAPRDDEGPGASAADPRVAAAARRAAAAGAAGSRLHDPPAGRQPAQSLPSAPSARRRPASSQATRATARGGHMARRRQGRSRRRRRRDTAGGAAARRQTARSSHGSGRPQALQIATCMPISPGKHGLIVGVANKRSISWAIAQAAAAAGARLALTYPSERLEENVRELAATLDEPLVLPCDVTSDEQIDDAGGDARSRVRRPRLPRARRRVRAAGGRLTNPFVETSREGFRIALDVSAYSLIALTRAVAPLMEKRGGGSILTLTYLGSERVFTELQRDGRGEGGARSVGPLPGERPRAEEHPRQRDLGRADQDARGHGHLRLLEHPAGLPRARAAAPQRRASARSPTPPCFCFSPASAASPARS